MKTVKLKEISTINPAVPAHLRNGTNEVVSFVPMSSLTTEGQLEGVKSRKIQEVNKGYRYFEEGDVLFAKITPCMENGKAGLAKGLPAPIAFGSTEFHVIRPGAELNSLYLHFLVRQVEFRYLAEKRMTGAGGQRRVPTRFLENFKVLLPSIDEQFRIATLLSSVETLIATRKASLDLLDDFLKSTFLEMFGPTNPDFEKWPVTDINDLAANHKGSMRTGPFGSNLLHSEFSESGDVAVLGIDNAVKNKFAWGEKRFISKEKYEELKNYKIFAGDVIVTIMGTIGRSAVIPDDIPLAINTKHLAAITFDTKLANPKFMSYSIHSSPYVIKQFASKTRGAIMSGLNLGVIKETKINKPPIELQDKFGEIIEKTESIKMLYEQILQDLENLCGALSQKAFKGELDVSRVPLDVVITPESAQITITGHAPTVIVTNRFNKTAFVSLLNEFKKKPFNFELLWKMIEEKEFNETPSYEEIKKLIFGLLEEKEPILSQSFDEENNEIVMSVNA